MTSPFTELLNRFRSIECSYNACDVADAPEWQVAHDKVMDEVIERQLVPSTASEMLEALRQAKHEMSDNGNDKSWARSLDGCFVNAALTYAEQIEAELPVDRVNRLATELAHALDAWNAYTNIPFIAHVYPASSGKGLWFENGSIDAMLAERDAAVSKDLAERLSAYVTLNEEVRRIENSEGFDAAEAEFNAKEAAEMDVIRHPCKTLEDVRAKARLALDDENVFDSIHNCGLDDQPVLMKFLRSLLGEDA